MMGTWRGMAMTWRWTSPRWRIGQRICGCHESQLQEWLPWWDRHNLSMAKDKEAWRGQYRSVLERRKAALGITSPGIFEVFNVTAWGVVPSMDQLRRDFPDIDSEASRLKRLEQRLDLWRTAAGE